jgi:hypothetical protein
MITVLFTILVMTVFATAAVDVVNHQQKRVRHDQDFQSADQSALAAVDDYVARLQADPNYFVNGNTDATNPAFTGYEALPGGSSSGTFKYAVDTSQAYTTGLIKITATGRVNGVDRTVTAQLRKSDFLDYMYFTKYETLDPTAYQNAVALPNGTNCAVHYYDSRNSKCSLISFGSFDKLKGPVHSQDEVWFSGNPTFQNEFSTEWNDSAKKYWSCLSGYSCSPSFASNYPPTYSVVPFPNTNLTLAQYADPRQGGQGCIFQGPTNIVLKWGGTMAVTSPETPSTFNTGACGTHNWATATTVNVPTNQVVYVEAPESGSYSCTTPTGFPYPISGDTNTATGPAALKPSCAHGDVFVQGWLQGKLTIGAANNVYVTGNVRYQGTNTDQTISDNVPSSSSSSPYSKDTAGNDVLGLSANSFIEVLHSLTGCSARNSSGNQAGECSSPGNNSDLTNIQVDAALVASNDSFIVQDYDSGSALGVLTVNGGIIQAFRGPVATSSDGSTVSSGYAKDYNYDSRLRALTPPHLASLASSAWNVAEFGEGQAN